MMLVIVSPRSRGGVRVNGVGCCPRRFAGGVAQFMPVEPDIIPAGPGALTGVTKQLVAVPLDALPTEWARLICPLGQGVGFLLAHEFVGGAKVVEHGVLRVSVSVTQLQTHCTLSYTDCQWEIYGY